MLLIGEGIRCPILPPDFTTSATIKGLTATVATKPFACCYVSSPDRIRTGVTALRGRRPRPLDDGAVHLRQDLTVPAEPRFLAWPAAYRLPPRNRCSQPGGPDGDQDGRLVSATRLTAASTSSAFPLARRPSARMVVSSRPTRISRPRRIAARSTGQVAAP